MTSQGRSASPARQRAAVPGGAGRIVQLLVGRGHVQEDALEVRIRAEGLASLVGELLQELYLAQGRPDGDQLVFATRTGQPMNHANIVARFHEPLQEGLGLNGAKRDIDGKPVLNRNGLPVLFYGLHALRHAAASLFIEQGWTPKKIKTAMGHATIAMTYDTYGKLFRDSQDDEAALIRLDAILFG